MPGQHAHFVDMLECGATHQWVVEKYQLHDPLQVCAHVAAPQLGLPRRVAQCTRGHSWGCPAAWLTP